MRLALPGGIVNPAEATGPSGTPNLEQLDEQGITPFHLEVLLVSGMGFFTDAYDLFVISVVVVLLKDQRNLTPFQVSLVNSSATLVEDD
jgi:MFS transporter, PHS family, inorganic phosphate transporter